MAANLNQDPVRARVPAKIVNGKKTFTVLENNPEILTQLSHTLGLSQNLKFTDIYSLSDPDLISLIPRPVLGLIAIIPLTASWKKDREEENAALSLAKDIEKNKGVAESVHWFKQTIGNACGSYALIHTVLNGPAKDHIVPNSSFSNILAASTNSPASSTSMEERAKILYNNQELEISHQEAAQRGDSETPEVDEQGRHVGMHFVAFVKEGGALWELEGSRSQPLNRGQLAEDEDVMSERAIAMGIGRIVELEKKSALESGGDGGDFRFSLVGLVEDK